MEEKGLEVTYLLNSGFLLRDEGTLLAFDDYADPTNEVQKALESTKVNQFYIFVSHAHFDHFDSHILQHAPHVTKYIVSNDCQRTKRIKAFPKEKLVLMKRYSEWKDDFIHVKSYSSTDVGTSYLVELANGKKIFHAGDFNFWYWSDDIEENKIAARNEFDKQMERLIGMQADIAFFPIDGRLGSFNDLGAREFFWQTEIKALIAMHNVGFKPWIPDREFFGGKEPIPTWCPTESGESRSFFNTKDE